MQSDFVRFKEAVLSVAKNNLDRLDMLSAFAVVLQADSDTISFKEAPYTSDDPQKDADTLEEWLCQQARTGAYRAVAWCAPVEIALESGQGKVRALYAFVESSSGEAVDVYVPFEKRDAYEFQEEIVVERTPTIFTVGGS